MHPAVLSLAPLFKESVGEAIKSIGSSLGDGFRCYARGVENYMTSVGRGAEAIMVGIGRRIGGPGPG